MTEAFGRPPEKTLIFTTTRNNEEAIGRLCHDVLSSETDADLLVVDEGSTDETLDILERIQAESSRLTIVRRPRSLGVGSAHLLAMLRSIQQDYHYLVTLGDAAAAPCVSDLRESLETSQCCQLDTNPASMGAGIVGLFAGPLAGLPVGHPVSPTRGYRVELLRGLDLSELPSDELPFLVEVTQRIRLTGARMKMQDSAEGCVSSHGGTEGVRAVWRAVKGALSKKLHRRPDPDAIDTRCYSCNSRYLVERFRRSGDVSMDVRAYQCTSMDHRSKPQVLSCLQCGLEYVQEREMPRDLEDMYADVVDDTYLQNIAARQKTFGEVYARIESAFPDLDEGSPRRMLELGCYCGAFMEVAQSHGWETQGVEPSRWASGYARERGLDVHCGTLDDFPAPTEKFDVIVMWDVLEHVKDPVDLLQQAQEYLTDDGVIFLSTLDIDNWFPRLTGKAWPWLMSMHIFYYSADSLTDLFHKAGLRMDEVQPYCHYISVRYFVEKICTLLPAPMRPLVSWLKPITPRSFFIPFHFGDIKLYTGSKIPTAAPAPIQVEAREEALQ